MNAYICTIIFIAFALACLPIGTVTADVLPGEGPENQRFTTTSIIDATGATNQKTGTIWLVGDKGIDSIPIPRDDEDGAIRSGSIAYVTYSDFIMSNGGQISEVKSFSLDTHAKTEGLYNIEATKVLTYTSQNGSHLMGEESYVLDVAGNWSKGIDETVCVFSRSSCVGGGCIPAFCNKVTASSKLMSVTTAQVETAGALTAVGETLGVPAVLKYEISITPDSNSASGYADAIVSTAFTVSVMEGRPDCCGLGATNCADLTNPLDCMKRCVANAWLQGADPRTCKITWSESHEFWVCVLCGDKGCAGFKQLDCGGFASFNACFTDSGLGGQGYTEADCTLVDTTAGGEKTYTFDGKEDGWHYDRYDELAAALTSIDNTLFAGGISTFNQVFDYQSGISCSGGCCIDRCPSPR